MKNLGLEKGIVRIISHQNTWHTNFEKEKSLIISLNSKHIKSIEHVGSTSISGMPAKPIIDLVVGIDRYYNKSKLIKGLSSIGYEFRLEPRRCQSLFVKMDGEKETHYLKVLRYRGIWWNEYLRFKSSLLSNKKFFREYKNLKLKLGSEFLDNRKEYTRNKSSLIKKILKY